MAVAELKKATERAERKDADDAARAMEEEEKAKEAAGIAACERKPPIKFKDAVGRRFRFPWEICSTWRVCYSHFLLAKITC